MQGRSVCGAVKLCCGVRGNRGGCPAGVGNGGREWGETWTWGRALDVWGFGTVTCIFGHRGGWMVWYGEKKSDKISFVSRTNDRSMGNLKKKNNVR